MYKKSLDMLLERDLPLIDDIGSFPLPESTNVEYFKRFYWDVYRAIVTGFKRPQIMAHRGFRLNVIQPILDSYKLKVESGLDLPSYSRHWDMHTPFIKAIEKYHEDEMPYVIKKDMARIIEVDIIREYARDYYRSHGIKSGLRVCITGALELYLKLQSLSVYKDLALNLAKSINRFAKKAIYHDNFFDTPVISIDEPSIGIVDFKRINDDDIIDILEKETEGLEPIIQIHLHSLSKSDIALQAKNIDVLTCEYASDPKNKIPRKALVEADKFMRVGITRTNISTIISEAIDRGRDKRDFMSKEGIISIIDSKDTIKRRYREALEHYGDRLKFVGPDCGLIGWTPPEAAFMLLKRTVDAVHEFNVGLKTKK